MTDPSFDSYHGNIREIPPRLGDAQPEDATAVAENSDRDSNPPNCAEPGGIVTAAATLLRARADAFAQRETTEWGDS